MCIRQNHSKPFFSQLVGIVQIMFFGTHMAMKKNNCRQCHLHFLIRSYMKQWDMPPYLSFDFHVKSLPSLVILSIFKVSSKYQCSSLKTENSIKIDLFI